MKPKHILVAGGIVICLVCLGVWNQIEEKTSLSVRSEVVALHAALEQAVRNQTIRVDDVELTGDWQYLADGRRDAVLRKLSAGFALDHSSHGSRASALLDAWGEKFFVAVRKNRESIQFSVRSKGPDRAIGTRDDIVSGNTGTLRASQ